MEKISSTAQSGLNTATKIVKRISYHIDKKVTKLAKERLENKGYEIRTTNESAEIEVKSRINSKR